MEEAKDIQMMWAVVVEKPGEPVLKRVPVPEPKSG